MKPVKNLFLNEKFILAIILLNAVIIYLQACNIDNIWIQIIDAACTLVFVVEMIIKHNEFGFKGYWSSGWNRLDGILVLISIPSLIALFVPTGRMDWSFLIILRLLRAFRFLRLLHFFPNITPIFKGFKLALRESYAILFCFFILIIVFGLINCSLFKDISPEFFNTPLTSIYSVFRLCTVEGWYEIPDSIAAATSASVGSMVRFYFCLLLVMGGIIGMSLINSIFVDAMVSDNNDDVKAKLDEMEKKLDELLKQKEQNNLTEVDNRDKL